MTDVVRAPAPADPEPRAQPPAAARIVAVPIAADRSLVQLFGDVDVSNAGVVAAALDHELAGGHRLVLLDLSGLEFLDCAGVRTLVIASSAFRTAGGRLGLTRVPPRVRRLFALCRVDDVLFVVDPPSSAPAVPHVAAARGQREG